MWLHFKFWLSLCIFILSNAKWFVPSTLLTSSVTVLGKCISESYNIVLVYFSTWYYENIKIYQKLKNIVNFKTKIWDFIHCDLFCGNLVPELLSSADLEKLHKSSNWFYICLILLKNLCWAWWSKSETLIMLELFFPFLFDYPTYNYSLTEFKTHSEICSYLYTILLSKCESYCI